MKIGVILASHGEFAKSALETVEMIAGKQEDVVALGLSSEMGADQFERDVCAAYDKLTSECDLVVALCDIHGGTPFNVITKVIMKGYPLIAFTGMSMPVVIELLISRDTLDTPSAVKNLIVSAHKQTLSEIVMPKIAEEFDELNL